MRYSHFQLSSASSSVIVFWYSHRPISDLAFSWLLSQPHLFLLHRGCFFTLDIDYHCRQPNNRMASDSRAFSPLVISDYIFSRLSTGISHYWLYIISLSLSATSVFWLSLKILISHFHAISLPIRILLSDCFRRLSIFTLILAID